METKEKKTTAKAVETPKVKKNTWEIKDRYYHLVSGQSPLTTRINSKHSSRKPLMWFDEEKQHNRELRYATNMKSPFMDEQKGTATLGHIVFHNGVLMVPRDKQALQKLLSLYHPDLNGRYSELQPQLIAEDMLIDLELELMSLNAAKNMDVEQSEAIMRVEIGSSVGDLSSKELKRDLMMFAKRNPRLFIELAKDENVMLRNFGIKATEQGIISISQDQRTFMFGKNKRKLFTIPFDENPYSALAAWFKTDEGVEVYKTIEKKLF